MDVRRNEQLFHPVENGVDDIHQRKAYSVVPQNGVTFPQAVEHAPQTCVAGPPIAHFYQNTGHIEGVEPVLLKQPILQFKVGRKFVAQAKQLVVFQHSTFYEQSRVGWEPSFAEQAGLEWA